MAAVTTAAHFRLMSMRKSGPVAASVTKMAVTPPTRSQSIKVLLGSGSSSTRLAMRGRLGLPELPANQNAPEC
jgi:hypothetical protein